MEKLLSEIKNNIQKLNFQLYKLYNQGIKNKGIASVFNKLCKTPELVPTKTIRYRI